mmetsp:Transcript_5209/g.32714  ORF Transcript_5209/g.32714 Transcript_5209/m.32714 type:complete len:100 (+) Transcript_5209:3741-4040(+)
MLLPCKQLPFTTRGRKEMSHAGITSCGPTRDAWETNPTHIPDCAFQLYNHARFARIGPWMRPKRHRSCHLFIPSDCSYAHLATTKRAAPETMNPPKQTR